MPATTPNRAYPYPLPADSINVPRDIEALARAIDTDTAAVAAGGLLLRAIKPSTEGGFGGGTEYRISGLDLTCPAPGAPTRTHQIAYSIKIIPSTVPPSGNTSISISVRQGSLTGTVIDSHLSVFHTSTTPYGWNLNGEFMPTGLVSGALYVITASSDGTGRFSIPAGAWSGLYDVT
jgi:hypothetical protein